MRALTVIAAGMLAALALSACGTTRAQGLAVSGTNTNSQVTLTSSDRCTIQRLSLAQPMSNGAMGSIALHFTFTNRSSTACTLYGYPGLGRLNANRQVMPTIVVRGTSVVVPKEPERTVVLAPGGHASFFAGYSDVPSSPGPCPASAYLEVTPPNAYDHFTIPLKANVCRRTITVSPVIAGA